MNEPQVIGTLNPSIEYVDRPTVKALVINSDNQILIINDGLLPGGGVENGESDATALHRELLEELGIEVTIQQNIATVIQYRDFLKKRYIVRCYSATYTATIAAPTPQDDREARITYGWYSLSDARQLVEASIHAAENNVAKSSTDDTVGKLFNLMTTKRFLETFEQPR